MVVTACWCKLVKLGSLVYFAAVIKTFTGALSEIGVISQSPHEYYNDLIIILVTAGRRWRALVLPNGHPLGSAFTAGGLAVGAWSTSKAREVLVDV